ncbi:MAG: S1 family peptidase [Chloroflexi bacterium]|nr:S1 family peptidase [Chloroflexota bacterium]
MNSSMFRNRLNWRILTTAVLALAIVAMIGPNAANALLSEQPDEGDPGGMELYFEAYAKEFKVSIAEAERRYDRLPELKALMREIVAAEDGRIAGWGTVHEPQFGGWVYLVGDDPPTAATAAIQRQNADIFIDFGADYTLAELQDAMTQRSTWESIPESMRERIAHTDIDIKANALVVAIDKNIAPVDPSGDGQGGPDTIEAIEALPLPDAAKALEMLLEAETGLPFAVVVDSRGTPDDSVYGGELLVLQSGSGCTSGFAVVKNGTRGLLTAGHCSTPWWHYRSRTSARTGSYYTAWGQDVVSGNSGDTQWYTLTYEWEEDDFYYSTTTNRDLTATEERANMYGDFVCHFGIGSGQTCGYVVSTNFDPHMSACSGWPFYCNDKWVKVEGTYLIRCGGDSGGPWYMGSVGYGTHSTGGGGDYCYDASQTDWAAFFAIDDIEDVLGVTVVTY